MSLSAFVSCTTFPLSEIVPQSPSGSNRNMVYWHRQHCTILVNHCKTRIIDYISFPQPDDLSEKFFEAERNIAISVFIISFEDIRHPLQADTSLHKKIEAHSIAEPTSASPSFFQPCSFIVICSVQYPHKWLCKSIAKSDQCFREFTQRYSSTAILVKAFEKLSPSS